MIENEISFHQLERQLRGAYEHPEWKISLLMSLSSAGATPRCVLLWPAEQGASVALIERAPEEKRGGNSKFTGGGFRMVHHGTQHIKRVVPDSSDADIARTDFGEYSALVRSWLWCSTLSAR
jgi:hypothetical protein